MGVVVYNDPKEFWKEASPSLKRDEARNSLFLGLSYLFQTAPENCVYQSLSRGPGDDIAAIVVSKHRTNRNFLPTTVEDLSQALELFQAFEESRIEITGIIGEVKVVKIYRDLFEKRNRKFEVRMTQGIYRCRKVEMPEVPFALDFRKAGPSDVEKIGQWIEEFHHEAVPHEPPIDGVELAKEKIDMEQIYVLEKEGLLLSMAGWSRDIDTSCSINLVYTPRDLRGNGYGSIVTAKLTQHFLENGKTETNLYTDMSNPTSNKIYQNIGYKFVCDSVHLGVSD